MKLRTENSSYVENRRGIVKRKLKESGEAEIGGESVKSKTERK